MKKDFFKQTVFILIIILSVACSKKNDTSENCKTCSALGGPDQQTITREICSEQEEQSFRSEFAGGEISCQ